MYKEKMLAAAKDMESRPWFRSGRLSGTKLGGNGTCLVLALGSIIGDVPKEIFFTIADHLELIHDGTTSSACIALINWNDKVATSKEEVISVLREVADKI